MNWNKCVEECLNNRVTRYSRTVLSWGVPAIFVIIYALLSVVAVGIAQRNWAWNGDPRATIAMMVDGTAALPYVGRVLIPQSVHVLSMLIPPEYQSALVTINQWVRCYPEGKNFAEIMVSLFAYGFAFSYALILYALAKNLLPQERLGALVVPVISLLMVSAINYNMRLYDFSTLFLMTGCYYFLVKQAWWRFLCCFALALLNKESTVFIMVLYAVWARDKMSRRAYVFFGVAQLALAVLIKGIIQWSFRNNPGVFLEFNWRLQMDYFLNPLWPHNYVSILAFVLMLLYGWKNKPIFLKQAVLMLFPMSVAFFFVGYPGEFRVFYDIFPIFALLITDTFIRMARIEPQKSS